MHLRIFRHRNSTFHPNARTIPGEGGQNSQEITEPEIQKKFFLFLFGNHLHTFPFQCRKGGKSPHETRTKEEFPGFIQLMSRDPSQQKGTEKIDRNRANRKRRITA